MNDMQISHLGYAEARHIDDRINTLLSRYPIEKPENKSFWRVFIRTVKTSLEIVEETANL